MRLPGRKSRLSSPQDQPQRVPQCTLPTRRRTRTTAGSHEKSGSVRGLKKFHNETRRIIAFFCAPWLRAILAYCFARVLDLSEDNQKVKAPSNLSSTHINSEVYVRSALPLLTVTSGCTRGGRSTVLFPSQDTSTGDCRISTASGCHTVGQSKSGELGK